MDPKLCLVVEKIGHLEFYNFGFLFFGSTKRRKKKRELCLQK